MLRFHFEWSDYELKQAVHMQQTFAQIIEGMGGKVTGKVETDGRKIITAGGSVNHEMGTARMSATPKEGVINSLRPGLGCAECLLDRRRAVRLQSLQESDAHHPRAGLARLRSPHGGDEAREHRLIARRSLSGPRSPRP